jgi:hypothetical protein
MTYNLMIGRIPMFWRTILPPSSEYCYDIQLTGLQWSEIVVKWPIGREGDGRIIVRSILGKWVVRIGLGGCMKLAQNGFRSRDLVVTVLNL